MFDSQIFKLRDFRLEFFSFNRRYGKFLDCFEKEIDE